jgi:2-methylcitrate dehydratase PrpD
MTVSERLAAFAAALSWPMVPTRVGRKVCDHILDTVGVMCAGAATQERQFLLAALDPQAHAHGASVAGDRTMLSAKDAAFANAFAGRIYTFDDTLEAGPVHPGSSVVAAALATAESIGGVAGEDLICAVLAGYEVTARVALGLGPAHYGRGFHSTGTCNVFGAAAAAARVRKLDASSVQAALGIAGGMAAGLRQHQIDGSMADSALNGAHAAMAGVLAASLAAVGFLGPPGIIDGRFGLASLMTEGADYASMTEGLGDAYRFEAVALKPYPTCRFTHGPVHEALRLSASHQLAAERIAGIELAAFRQSIEVSDRPCYATRTEALLSHQFSLAIALSRGRLTLDDLDVATIADPGVRAQVAKIAVVHGEDLEAAYPERWKHRLRISLADGETLEAESQNPPGGIDQPMARDAIMQKFIANATPVLGDAQSRRLASLVSNLAEVEDACQLGDLLRAPSTPLERPKAAE